MSESPHGSDQAAVRWMGKVELAQDGETLAWAIATDTARADPET